MAKTKEREKRKALVRPRSPGMVKLEIFGQEMVEKKVKRSGASGRVYLPFDWVDRSVKVIRID